MSFPFPLNPVDGQVVSATAPDGSILTATYRAAKNEWELTRTPAPSSAISSGAPPMPVVVTATADGQVITWDQVAGRWVAKVPATAATGTTKSFVKAQQADPDQANGVGPAQLRQGDIQLTAENLHKELKFWNGAAWVESLSEDTIKQWISAGSLFRGVVKESGLAALPAVALANRGFYYSWTGNPGHVVSAADPAIGTDLAGEVLQVGDWIQSDGTKWVHVPGDLLSKQRWDSLGSFAPWSDTSWEKGALVSYQQGFWRANALISPGDDAPEVAPGNKWTDITPHPSIKLAELADVNDNVALQGEDGVLIWSEIDQEFVVSRTLQVDAIEFDATGPGIGIEGLFQGDISLGKNLDTQVPSVEAVARYVDSRSLEDLAGSTDLNTAQNGEFIAYDAANNKWVPKAASSSIAGLTDVDLTTAPTDGQALEYNLASLKWKPVTPTTTVATLKDVDLTVAPTDGQVLEYNLAALKWKPVSPVTKVSELKDVDLTVAPTDKQALVYDNKNSKWKAVTPVDAYEKKDTYSRTETNALVTAVVTGLEHGMAVEAIVNDPPAAPVQDEVYIVGTAPTGAWVGHTNELAYWDGKAWVFNPAQAKEAHMVEDQTATYSWNGTAWVKVAAATTAAASGGDLWQVGSIQQSLLTETQWATTLGAEATKWVLCDGRNVAGSKWATITGQTTVPDMRGGFLRCAGQNSNTQPAWNGGTVGSYHNDTTRAPRNTALTGTTSTAGQHHHEWGMSSRQSKGGGDYMVVDGWDVHRYTSDDGNHTHNVTINGGGDVETAPSHFSVNTFIKVN